MTANAQLKIDLIWRYEDYRELPDDGNRYEIIDGELIVTPAPTVTHQTVSKRIQFALMEQIEAKGKGFVFNAPIDVIFNQTNVVQPDIVVLRTERQNIITPRGIAGAPDIVIEILSPTTAKRDRTQKAKLYASYGVKEYWLVDPEESKITLFTLTDDGFAEKSVFSSSQTFTSTICDISLSVDAIFAPGWR